MQVSLESATHMLARTPGVLRAMLVGVDERWTTPDYGPGTWSAKEVVAHLIHAERTDWVPRMQWILERGESRPFEPFDRAGHKEILAAHTLVGLMGLFERERSESLASVRAMGLTDAGLSRRGTHPALGTVTLGNLLATWVVHDLNHLSQIAKAMAYQYKAEVGAWEAYLSVLGAPNPR